MGIPPPFPRMGGCFGIAARRRHSKAGGEIKPAHHGVEELVGLPHGPARLQEVEDSGPPQPGARGLVGLVGLVEDPVGRRGQGARAEGPGQRPEAVVAPPAVAVAREAEVQGLEGGRGGKKIGEKLRKLQRWPLRQCLFTKTALKQLPEKKSTWRL